MEPFEAEIRQGDAVAVRALLSAHPGLRDTIDQPTFETAPAIVFSRHDRAMVDVLLVDVVRVLIARGADLEIRNDYGGTALGSCQWGSLNFRNREGDYPACAEALLQGGAGTSESEFGSDDVRAVVRRHAARSVK